MVYCAPPGTDAEHAIATGALSTVWGVWDNLPLNLIEDVDPLFLLVLLVVHLFFFLLMARIKEI